MKIVARTIAILLVLWVAKVDIGFVTVIFATAAAWAWTIASVIEHNEVVAVLQVLLLQKR